MRTLGDLLKEAWRTWTRSDLECNRTQEIIDLALAGNIESALATAHKHNRHNIRWEKVAQDLASSGRKVGNLIYLALRLSADRYAALLALGHWLAANREPLRAYLCAEEAHQLSLSEPAPLILMGWIQLSIGNPQSAGHHFLAALRRDEGSREAWQGYRAALQQTQGVLPPTADTPDEQDIRLRTAIVSSPEDFQTHLDLGRHYATTSRCVLALPYLRTACELAMQEREPAYWLAWSLANLGEYQAALDVARTALGLFPEDIGLLKLVATCAMRCGQESQAIEWLEHALEQHGENAEVLGNLGDCYNHMERFEEGECALTRALALDSALNDARHNLAYALHCLGRYDESRTHLDILLESERNDFSARWYRSSTLLAAHDFREAWQDYEFRFVASAVETRIIPLPVWGGEDLAGKKIIVVAEQGIGDEIMFASCIPELLHQSSQCVIECNRRLVKLFQRSFPQAHVLEWASGAHPHWLEQHQDADYHVFCGSLPLYFRNNLDSYRNCLPYLVADTARTSELRQRITSLGTGLKVGIAWRGGGNASRTRTRSLSISQLNQLLSMSGCCFVSIQYGDCTAEVDSFRQETNIQLAHWPEVIENLDDFASLVAALDIIVTVCSAPVHFAGAQGKPTLVLTPFAPEWRYRGINQRMLWYPSVRLFPQEQFNDWSGAINNVVAALSTAAALYHAA